MDSWLVLHGSTQTPKYQPWPIHSQGKPETEHKPKFLYPGSCYSKSDFGRGHYADTTSETTYILNPNFAPARGGLNGSTGLSCQHTGFYLSYQENSQKPNNKLSKLEKKQENHSRTF